MSEPQELSISELRSKRGETLGPPRPVEAEPDDQDQTWQQESVAAAARAASPSTASPLSPAPRPMPTVAPAWRSPADEVGLRGTPPWRIDPWRLLSALRQRWVWVLFASVGTGALCFGLGLWLWKTTYQVSVQLIRRQGMPSPAAGQEETKYKFQELSETTVRMLLASPQIMQRVSEQSVPHVPAQDIVVELAFEQQRSTETLTLKLKGYLSPNATADLANLYASNVVRFTEEVLARDAREVAGYLSQQLTQVEPDLETATKDLQAFTKQTQIIDVDKETEAFLRQWSEVDLNYEKARIDFETLDLKYISVPQQADPASDQLTAARRELETLMVRYTENHPLVKDQMAKVDRLQKAQAETRGAAAAGDKGALPSPRDGFASQKEYLRRQMQEYDALRTSLKTRLSGLSQQGVTYARLKANVQRLQSLHSLLATRQREARLYVDNGLGYYSILNPAEAGAVKASSHWPKVIALTLAGLLLGLLGSGGLVLLVESLDVRLKTAEDVKRATRLPVLATLGDLQQMDEAEQSAWAFRTWTELSNSLSAASNQELVCGFISAQHGEGRSTWMKLLANAARDHGFHVLTVTVPDSREARKRGEAAANDAEPPAGAEFLTNPAQVTQHLLKPDAHEVIELQLPAWLWNRERRAQFQTALAQWRKPYNLVLLIELPPADSPESVLLAEYVPQLFWVVGSGVSRAGEARRLLQTLRHARRHVVGAVLNREPASPLKDRLPL